MRLNTILRRQLISVAATVLPLVLTVAIMLAYLYGADSRATLENLKFGSRLLSTAVSAELQRFISAGNVMSSSATLQADDPEGFRAVADRNLKYLNGGWIIIHDTNGQQLMNTRVAAGSPLPRSSDETLGVHRQALETHAPVVRGTTAGPVGGIPSTTVVFPVYRNGVPHRLLTIVLGPDRFYKVLLEQYKPSNWLLAITDQRQLVIARTQNNAEFAGKLASAGWRAGVAASPEDGFAYITSLEGIPYATQWHREPISGWTVGVSVDTRAIVGPYRTTFIFGVGACLLVMLTSVMLAMRLARDISEINSNMRDHARVQERVMMELAHRSRNLITVLRGISHHLVRADSSAQQHHQRFDARLESLARSHDVLLARGWTNATVLETVRVATQPHSVVTRGPDTVILASSVQNLGMALAELVENSAKYGALRCGDPVHVQWTTRDDEVHVSWLEHTVVSEDAFAGYGTLLLQRYGTLERTSRRVKWSTVLYSDDRESKPA